MKKLLGKIKHASLCFLREFLIKHGRHYAWPMRLHSRMYSWNRFYEKSGVKRVNLGAGPYFNKSGWISIDMISSEKVAFSSKKFISKRIGVDKLNLSNVDLCYSSHF